MVNGVEMWRALSAWRDWWLAPLSLPGQAVSMAGMMNEWDEEPWRSMFW